MAELPATVLLYPAVMSAASPPAAAAPEQRLPPEVFNRQSDQRQAKEK